MGGEWVIGLGPCVVKAAGSLCSVIRQGYMLGSTAGYVGRLDCKDANGHFSGFLVFQS